MLSTLRQPRYLGLFGLMVVLAIICGLAGTWQIFRFEQKRDANHHLRADDRDHPRDITSVLGPANAPTSDGKAQKFRHVTATGSYLPGQQSLLRGQTVGGDIGYLVITPLRTSDGVLLVARGFVPQTGAAETSPTVPAAPAGPLSVTVRLEPATAKADKFGHLPGQQIDAINTALQQRRIGAPVWNGYGELLAGQPGTTGLQVIPDPDLSNPAGGAEEPQHAAYVVQWYLFALLALAAPFVMAAAERRRDAAERAERAAAQQSPRDEPSTTRTAPGPATIEPDAPTERLSARQRARQRKASLDDRLAGRT